MSPQNISSSSDNDGGFQRGFLLKKPKSRLRPKSTNPLPSKPSGEAAGAKTDPLSVSGFPIANRSTAQSVRVKEASNQNDQHQSLASGKKDSGWAKGFLTSKQESKSTATKKSRKVGDSKKPNPPVETNSGWSKGFLTNKNTSKKGKKTKDGTKRNKSMKLHASETERGRSQSQARNNDKKKTQASGNLLLSIGDDCNDDVQCRNAGMTISPAKIAPTIAPTNEDRSQLISVIFDGSANETAPNQPDPGQSELILDCNENENEGNRKGTSTNFSTKSFISPLISITKKDGYGEEENSSSILIKEVSTTRIHNQKSRKNDKLRDGTEEKSNSPQKHHSVSTISSANMPIKSDKQGVSSLKGDSGGNYKGILEIQLESERLFSGSTKGSQVNDSEATIHTQLRTLEHRRYAWIYVLQQRQQQHANRKNCRLKKSMEENVCDYQLQALFDIEFFSDNDINADGEISLEPVLLRLETESERRRALEAVLMIQEYFVFRHKEQERDRQHDVERSSRKTTGANLQAKGVKRVIRLFVRLTDMSLENRRTILAQTAWETSILLLCFCIRRESSKKQQLTVGVAPTILWENLDSLLQQQLKWQKSKTKQNDGKIVQLQEILVETDHFLSTCAYAYQEASDLVAKLEKLIGM